MGSDLRILLAAQTDSSLRSFLTPKHPD